MRSQTRGPVLHVAHAVIFAALLLRTWFNWLLAGSRQGIHRIACRLALVRPSATQQSQPRRGKQTKPPQALAVILADSDSSITPLWQLANVLKWCLRRDIRTLFVYHPQGAGPGQLQQLLDLLAGHAECNVSVQAGFGPLNGSSRQHSRQKFFDSSSNRRPACVHLLDADDARWPLVHAAASDQQPPDAADGSLHPAAALHSQVARAAGDAAAVEPDIVLVCGEALTLAGFPPWLLRFGELYHLGRLKDVTDAQLCQNFQKYSSVTQRFGT